MGLWLFFICYVVVDRKGVVFSLLTLMDNEVIYVVVLLSRW